MAKHVVKEPKEKTAVARTYTINMHRLLKDYHGKKRAARAIREIKKFASREMKTSKVEVSPELNGIVWSQGIRNVPHKLRLKVLRTKDADDKNVEGFKCNVVAAEGFKSSRDLGPSKFRTLTTTTEEVM